MKKHFSFIDVAKGICIIAIIMGHFGISYIEKVVFMFHVPVFFLISGYTLEIYKEKNKSVSFIRNKFMRLMIPYFTTCIFLIFLGIINQIFIVKNPTIYNVSNSIYTNIINMIFGSGARIAFGDLYVGSKIGAIWFLPCLFFSIVSAYFLLKLPLKYAFFLSVVISFLSQLSTKYFFLPFSIQPALFCLPFIIVGYISKKYNFIKEYLLSRKKYLLLCLCLCFAIYGYFTNNNIISCVQSSSPDYFITFFSTLSSSIIIIFISILLKNNRFFIFLGKNSLIILCVHLIALNTLGGYFNMILDFFEILSGRAYYIMFFHLILSICVIYLINLVKTVHHNLLLYKKVEQSNRILEIDISKGIIIILMLIGHFKLPYSLRNIIYSFHMPAFIVFSGYFYKKGNSLKDVKKLFKYYIYFSVFYFILNHNIIVPLYSMSFSKVFFKDIPSVGPVYFITMLICIKVIYYLIDKLKCDVYYKSGIIFIISLFGKFLADKGMWLPFSLDLALYSVIFFHVGYLIKKYNLLLFLKKYPYLYFLFAFIWVTIIYFNRFELATRVFGNYSFSIISAVSATFLLLLLAMLLKKSILIACSLKFIGCNTIYLLIFESLLCKYISDFASSIFDVNGLYYCILYIIIQLLLLIILKFFINLVNILKKYLKLFLLKYISLKNV